MGEVIFWGILIIIIAFIIGAYSNMLMDSNDSSSMGPFLLMCTTILFVISVTCFTFANQKYFEKKEYSVTDYHLNKKIITVDENDTVKVDTLYSFEKRN